MYINSVFRGPGNTGMAQSSTILSRPLDNLNCPETIRPSIKDLTRFEPREKGRFTHFCAGNDRSIEVALCYGNSREASVISSQALQKALGDLLGNVRGGSPWSRPFRVREENKQGRRLFIEFAKRREEDGISRVFDLSIWPKTTAAVPLIKGVVEFFKTVPPKTRPLPKIDI